MLAARDPPYHGIARLCQSFLFVPHFVYEVTRTVHIHKTRPQSGHPALFQLERPTGPQGDPSHLILRAVLRVLPPPDKTLGGIKH